MGIGPRPGALTSPLCYAPLRAEKSGCRGGTRWAKTPGKRW